MAAGQTQTVLLFYKYTAIEDPARLAEKLEAALNEVGAVGRVIVAPEGVNGNCGATREGIDRIMQVVEEDEVVGVEASGPIDWKLDEHVGSEPLFPDVVVKIQKEIVSTAGEMEFEWLGQGLGGNHLSPQDFHAVLAARDANGGVVDGKEVVVLDVRNRKEVAFGSFKGAEDSDTKCFAEWPVKFRKRQDLKDKKVLMFCTGGVRCEKASAFLRKEVGCDDVSQLSGGIHRYLEAFGTEGFFEGANFVFDARGLQVPKQLAPDAPPPKVVGKCVLCADPCQTLSSDRVCVVCRDSVIVCAPCRIAARGTYVCADHALFGNGIYHKFLDRFTPDELQAQLDGLQAVLDGPYSGVGFKTRRKGVRKQIARVQARLADLESNAASPSDDGFIYCHACSLPIAQFVESGDNPNVEVCIGKCWGFFGCEAPHPAPQ